VDSRYVTFGVLGMVFGTCAAIEPTESPCQFRLTAGV
jgi:hypothetical protein